MLCSKPAHGNGFHASGSAIVAQGYSRQEAQGVGHVGHPEAQHVAVVKYA